MVRSVLAVAPISVSLINLHLITLFLIEFDDLDRVALNLGLGRLRKDVLGHRPDLRMIGFLVVLTDRLDHIGFKSM